MSSTEINRRNLLAVIGALTSLDEPRYGDDYKYLFAPGLIYMNTGTMGPAGRRIPKWR